MLRGVRGRKGGVPVDMISLFDWWIGATPKGRSLEKKIEGKCWLAKCNKRVSVYSTDADTV